MFKRFSIFLLSILIITSAAFADTITIDLDTATADELQAARDAINERIADILASDLSSVSEKFTLKGKGTKILEGVDLLYTPARLFVKSTAEIKVTLCSDGKNRTYDGSNSSGLQFAHLIDKEQSISSIIVETQGEWSLEFSPIELTQKMITSGSGSCITDYFLVSPPQIVSISFNDGWYAGYTYIYLYKIHANNSVSCEEWMWQDFVTDETFDYIIKPESNVKAYFIMISCPHDTRWSITTK